MTILVTGATGFVGPHVVSEGAAHDLVVALDLHPPDKHVRAFLARDAARAARVTWVQADVTDFDALSHAVRNHALTGIIHAAAVTPNAATAAAGMHQTVAINVLGTAHILDLARTRSVRRTVVFSSAAVYTPNDGEPITEMQAWRDTGVYAVSKQAIERLAAFASAGYGMDVVVVRPTALYGALERPTGAREAMSGIYSLMHTTLRGEEVRIHDDGIMRDWTAASEAGRAVVALFYAPVLAYPVYNIGVGHDYTSPEVLAAFQQVFPSARWRFVASDEANVTFGSSVRRGPLSIVRLNDVPDAALRDDLAVLLGEYRDWLNDHPY